jgi:general secretion pathway protein A
VKLLNVVLAGQPELGARLNEVGLRQLKQRIALRCELRAFDFQETAAYIAGRLRIAGGDPAAIFTREAILAIHAGSGGLPRTVNVICESALIGGFAGHTKPVTKALVDEVCRDFDLLAPQASFTAAPVSAAAQPQAVVPGQQVLAEQDPPEAQEAEGDEDEPIAAAGGRKRRFSFF